MPWSSPSTPVSGTTITVAWAQSSVVDPLNWLRQLTGGGDPGAANRVIYSTSGTLTTWGALPDAVMANQKVNRATDTMTGSLHIVMVGPLPDGTTYGSAQLEIQGTSNSAPMIGFHRPGVSAVSLYESGGELYQVLTSGVSGKLWTATNLTSANGLVPSGMIAAFATAGAIPSGWTRYSAADGRILIGAGTTFGSTFSENSNAGASSWAHGHAMVFESGTNNPAGGSVGGGSGSTAVPTHSHTISGNTNDTTWIPPTRVVVHAQKS